MKGIILILLLLNFMNCSLFNSGFNARSYKDTASLNDPSSFYYDEDLNQCVNYKKEKGYNVNTFGECSNWSSIDKKKRKLISNSLQFKNLRGSSFEKASLRGISLEFADLRGTNLEGADLRESEIFKARIEGATYNDSTKLPFSEDVANFFKMVKVGADENSEKMEDPNLNLNSSEDQNEIMLAFDSVDKLFAGDLKENRLQAKKLILPTNVSLNKFKNFLSQKDDFLDLEIEFTLDLLPLTVNDLLESRVKTKRGQDLLLLGPAINEIVLLLMSKIEKERADDFLLLFENLIPYVPRNENVKDSLSSCADVIIDEILGGETKEFGDGDNSKIVKWIQLLSVNGLISQSVRLAYYYFTNLSDKSLEEAVTLMTYLQYEARDLFLLKIKNEFTEMTPQALNSLLEYSFAQKEQIQRAYLPLIKNGDVK